MLVVVVVGDRGIYAHSIYVYSSMASRIWCVTSMLIFLEARGILSECSSFLGQQLY
jgi:hypothetical protein